MATVKQSLAAKATKKTVVKKVVAKKVTAPKVTGMNVPVYSIVGTSSGTLALPKEFFGAKVNKALLTQALRVYISNQKTHPGSTKTRGEVKGSTAKIYRQKGTGRARHGAIRAPIFVGGGITFGPKPRKAALSLPQKMKKAALISALSSKMSEKLVAGVTGLEKATGKTKEVVKFLEKVKGKNALIVTREKVDTAVRAARNIPGTNVLSVNQLNAYEVYKHQNLFFSKEALEGLSGTSLPQERKVK